MPAKKHYLLKIFGLLFCFIFSIIFFHLIHAMLQPFVSNEYDWLMLFSFSILTFVIICILNKYVIQQKIYFKFKINFKNNWEIILLLLGYFGWMIFKIFTSNWQITFSSMNVLKSFDAGINEEFIFRGIILILFIKLFLNKFPRYQRIDYIGAILLSTLLFSGLHALNIFTMQQNILVTILQIMLTISMGIINSIIYLRIKNLLIPMLMHFIWDLNPPVFNSFSSAVTLIITFLFISLIIVPIFIKKTKDTKF